MTVYYPHVWNNKCRDRETRGQPCRGLRCQMIMVSYIALSCQGGDPLASRAYRPKRCRGKEVEGYRGGLRTRQFCGKL